MTAGIWNITIEQGATFDRTLTWKDSEGVPIPLAGLTARMHIRQKVDDPTIVVALTTGNGRIILTDPGQIRLLVDAVTTSAIAITSGVHDIEIVDPGQTPERVTRLLKGTVTVSKEVTR